MADYLILFYSGAGNTEYVAKKIEKSLLETGHYATTIRVRKDTEINNIERFDGLIIGYPVYAYRAPETLINVLKKLPESPKPVFLFFTKGLILGNAAFEVARLLENKGYRIVGFEDLLMVDTLFILTAREGNFLHKFYLLPEKIFQKKIEKLPEKILKSFKENKIKKPGPKIYAPLTELIAKKFWRKAKEWSSQFYADEKCTLCGMCVSVCPRHNIKMEENKISFGNDCEFCLACLHRCPQGAIQIDGRTLNSPRYRILS